MARETIYNKLTSPEKLAQVNKDNLALAEDFLIYLKSMKRADTTIAQYRNDLNIFWCFLLDKCDNKRFADVSKRDLVAYQFWLGEENKNSPARIRRLKSTISSLSNYVQDILDEEKEFEGFRSIIGKVKNPESGAVREKTVFTEEQIQSLLDILVEKKQYQKACAVALAKYSGSRKSELLRFKASYFDKDNICFGAAYKTPEPIKTKGKNGGKYLKKFVLVKGFDPYLNMWLEERKILGVDSEWLFVNKTVDGQWAPMGVGTLNSWATSFSKMLGLDFYWHSLRHFFTTYLSEAGMPDDAIASMVGWQSTDMVTLYKDIDVETSLGKYFSNGDIIAGKKVGLNDL